MMRTAIGSAWVAALTASMAWGATETTWISPAGGLWHDPAHWSHGVPTESTHALLPALDDDGYTITIATPSVCASLTVAGESIALVGPTSLTVVGDVRVGTTDSAASLSLASLAISAHTAAVGVGGAPGSLSILGQATLAATELLVGHPTAPPATGGSSQLVIAERSLVQCTVGTLTPSATLAIESRPDVASLVVTGSLYRDGTLSLSFPPDYAVGSSWAAWIWSGGVPSGTFDAIVEPTVGPYTIEPTFAGAAVILAPIDPIVAIHPSLEQSPAFVGFAVPVLAEATTLSGATFALESGFTVSADDPTAAVTIAPRSIMPLGTMPFEVIATTVSYGVTIQGTLAVAPVEATARFTRVDINADGEGANDVLAGNFADLTPDGRWVVFASLATNLGPVDPWPSQTGIFVKDLWTGAVEQIDVGEALGPHPMHALRPSISSDGRFVTFDRPFGSPLNEHFIWLRDRWLQTTTLVSASPSGEPANGLSLNARIAGDGRFVVYGSKATNIVSTPAGSLQIFVYDTITGSNEMVSVAPDGTPGNNVSNHSVSVSSDGRFVVFETKATNLVGGSSNSTKIALIDRVTGAWQRVDDGPAGPALSNSSSPSISADGRFILFTSTDDILEASLGGTPDGGLPDVFVRDRVAGTLTHVSVDSSAGQNSGAAAASHKGLAISTTGMGNSPDSTPYVTIARTAPSGSTLLLRVDLATLVSEAILTDPWGQPIELTASGSGIRGSIAPDGSSVLAIGPIASLVPFSVDAVNSPLGLVVRRFGTPQIEDLTGDGRVGAADLAILIGAWGLRQHPADFDQDGVVAAGDLAQLLAAWSE
jgi:hypothetical protein